MTTSAAQWLATLLAMPRAELNSRRNAWEDVQRAGREVLAELDAATIRERVRASPPLSAGFDDGSAAGDMTGVVTINLASGETDLVRILPSYEPVITSLIDAQTHGQAHPLTRTVVIEGN